MFLFLEKASGDIPRMRSQARQQPDFPAALLCLIQLEFNESFLQAL